MHGTRECYEIESHGEQAQAYSNVHTARCYTLPDVNHVCGTFKSHNSNMLPSTPLAEHFSLLSRSCLPLVSLPFPYFPRFYMHMRITHFMLFFISLDSPTPFPLSIVPMSRDFVNVLEAGILVPLLNDLSFKMTYSRGETRKLKSARRKLELV